MYRQLNERIANIVRDYANRNAIDYLRVAAQVTLLEPFKKVCRWKGNGKTLTDKENMKEGRTKMVGRQNNDRHFTNRDKNDRRLRENDEKGTQRVEIGEQQVQLTQLKI